MDLYTGLQQTENEGLPLPGHLPVRGKVPRIPQQQTKDGKRPDSCTNNIKPDAVKALALTL